MFFPALLFALLTIFCFTAIFATQLPHDEVEGLRDVANALKIDWEFGAEPCKGTSRGWMDPTNPQDTNVTCKLFPSNGTDVWHVTQISLKSKNLQGVLPTDLSKLPYLELIDLTRNYLNGTIPSSWGTTQLQVISLSGNRLSGPIPKELGNISTLNELVVEFNQLSGELPAELGNLSNIRRMLLTSNNFNGSLPETFAKLTKLQDFRIGDNQLTGRIPSFIQYWKHLTKLVIQGSGFSGPIPDGIRLLTNLTDLRISDLTNGTEMQFPPLNNLTNLKTLILRSCNIVGTLPQYLSNFTKLKTTLDLSFNRLSGPIPNNFSALVTVPKTSFIYLTGNILNGTVPEKLFANNKNIDLSYNNFISQDKCEERKTNLFASSSRDNVSNLVSCLTSYRCPKTFYSFHINCGGEEAKIDGKIYEDDTNEGGASSFYQSGTNWAISNTGDFMDNSGTQDTYIVSTRISATPVLYMNARVSPISLTYYGFCLKNGNYTVRLHFAEITFTNDHTYSSLGRRIFDIYIQGKQVAKDFNIVKKAGGVGKTFIANYTAIVANQTLEIRFYWSGKGTTALPDRGVYGPLISAISVTSDHPPEGSNRISNGTLAGILVAIVAFIFFVLGVLWWKCCFSKDTIDPDLRGLDLQTGSFTLRQIKAATNNFDSANKIGEGGFGPVYKGFLSNGTVIAVKQLSSKSKQGNREFVNEIGMISALQHPHLVKLYGCCIEGNQLLLVYEYMENNSLARALFGHEEHQLHLDWSTRHKICVGIAKGLSFLHEESRLKIVHRDIKATNVLLDKHLNPKISDFGLAKLDEQEFTHISTRVAGTIGYMAPEYALRGYLTDKADVYSFGIVALEIVSGRSNTSGRSNMEQDNFELLEWARFLKEKGSILELVDYRLGNNYNKEEVETVIRVALLCSNVSPTVRPAMSLVAKMLEGTASIQDLDLESGSSKYALDELKIEAMRKHFQQITQHSTSTSESQTQSMQMEGPWTGSSTSTKDLYPISSFTSHNNK